MGNAENLYRCSSVVFYLNVNGQLLDQNHTLVENGWYL